MTRVLQIRRGTSAQNDNFTGMPGEITMDTDAKTLRIHDGETLGGFLLQRADQSANGTGNFDIETVPQDFWADLIPKYTNDLISVIETQPVPINSKSSYLNYVINDNKIPRFIQCVLICQNAEAGYDVGDEVWAFGIGSRTNPCPNYKINHDGLNIRLMVGCEKYWASHNESGTAIELNDENWRILFRVYY